MNAWIITTENHIISSMSTLKRKITCSCYRLDIFVLFRGKITGQSFPLSLVIYKMKTVMIILVKGIIDVMYKPLLSEKLPWSLHVYFIFIDFTIGHVIFTLSDSIFVIKITMQRHFFLFVIIFIINLLKNISNYFFTL